MDGTKEIMRDVFVQQKLVSIILHGRKMMGTAPASCLNLPKHFGSLYLEPVFFPHGQKPASAVSVFKQAILRYPCPKIDILVNFGTRVSDKAETSRLRGTTAIRGSTEMNILVHL